MAKKSSIDKELIDKIRGTLDSAANAQYDDVNLPVQSSSSSFTAVKWVMALSIMLISLFVFWSLQAPEKVASKVKFYSVENLIGFEAQAWQEDAGMLEDVDFYTWLALEGSLVEASNSTEDAK